MKIYLQNNLSGKKELFKPVHKKWFGKSTVGIYSCGPTVYSEIHIGNCRSYLFSDLLRRMFEYNGYKVNHVMNITDVGHLLSDSDTGEDKMEKAAREKGLQAKDIVKKYTDLFLNDLQSLNIDKSKMTFPKATDHIPEQIKIIQDLEKSGFVYKTSDGIYYDTSKFENYGKLGNINISGLKEGVRVEVNSEKINPTDFALWKFSAPGEKRQQEWDSPYGVGYPGWHIECSAMSKKYLGQPFDIHTGGIDLIPTHHNNEIAQSEGAYNKKQANYWLHNGHVMINGAKMSKSDGNVVYLREIQEKNIDPLAYRYWLLTSHYSGLVNFTYESLLAAETAYKKILNRFSENKNIRIGKVSKKYSNEFLEKINDDLNTAEGLAVVWTMLKDESVNENDKFASILEMDFVLGLNIAEKVSNLAQNSQNFNIPNNIIELAEMRQKARKNGDFKASDDLRQKISNSGFEIVDNKDGYEIKKRD